MSDSSAQPRLVRPVSRARWRRLLRIPGLALILVGIVAAGCNRGPPQTKEAKKVEVVVSKPITAQVTDYQDFTGRVDAIKTVDIRARVTGYVNEVPFKEGDLVKEGDLLFVIDPRPYKNALDAAKAQVVTAEANLKLAQITYRRSKDAADRGLGVVSPLELDQNRAQAERAAGDLQQAQANLEMAQLNMDWTEVRAPLSGRISRRNIDPGNEVKADDTLLTTIVTEGPMYVYFDVDERTYLDLVALVRSSQTNWLSELQFPVLVRLANEEKFAHPGKINFLDNRVNVSTGTIRMRGQLDNATGILKSGLFARVRLPIGAPSDAILVPDETLQSDQGRKYVYVIGKDNKIEYRSVEPGQAIEGLRQVTQDSQEGEPSPESAGPRMEPVLLRVIKKGLKGDEQVVVEGMQQVRPKMEVRVKPQPQPQPAEQPLTELLKTAWRAPEARLQRQGDKETRR